jgi:2-isopropylmalate synthase
MEEIVMALKTRKDFYAADTRVHTEEITRSSRLVTKITGIPVQPNKAIVGANAFAHESGIHQDGLLKERTTYEIMRPESVGLVKTNLVLGKHSGRHAFRDRLKEIGYELADDDLNKAFERFKRLADQKKEVFDEDLEAIVSDEMQQIQEVYALKSLHAESGTGITPSATVEMTIGGKTVKQTGSGDGPVDAVYRTIAAMTGTKSKLDAYLVKGITGGTDALGEVTVKVEEEGKKVAGHGADTDIIIASARAYVNALNKLEYWKKGKSKNS